MLRKNKHKSGCGTADRPPNQQTKNTRSTQNKDDYKGTIQVLNPIERELNASSMCCHGDTSTNSSEFDLLRARYRMKLWRFSVWGDEDMRSTILWCMETWSERQQSAARVRNIRGH